MTTTPTMGDWTTDLAARIAGQVLVAGDAGYDEKRLAWNRSHEHRPEVIVIPATPADVSVAVGFADAHDMSIAIQATGHGVARTADGAMLILTEALREVAIDPDARVARAGAGTVWGDVLAPAAEFGLAPLLGSTPHVGVVGYTLGGGMGWLARKFGLAADHVRSIEVVTADGEIRTASATSDPELFWGLRGGGAGSLGIVTAIEFDLVAVESLYAGNLLYPASMAREVAAHYRSWVDGAPDELTSSICFMNFPPFDEVPEPVRGRSFAIVRGAVVGSDELGASLLAHWREWRQPELDLWGRLPMSEVAAISNDPVDPMPGLATTEWLDDLGDGMFDVLIDRVLEQPGPPPLVFGEIRHAGGAISRAPAVPGAYDQRDREFVLELVGVTPTRESHDVLVAFLDALRSDLGDAIGTGAYLNFLEGEEKVRRTREAFAPEVWARLRALKAAVDPLGRFSHGIAIG